MSSIFQLILSMSLSGSALIIILMLLKPLFNKGFSKAWLYYIWIIVLVRLLVPYSPEYGLVNDLFQTPIISNITMHQVTSNDLSEHNSGSTTNITQQEQGNNETVSSSVIPAIKPALEHMNLPDVWEITGFIWLIGIMILFLVRISRYMYFVNHLKRNAEPITDSHILQIYHRTANELGFHKRPQIFYSEQIASPMLIGLRKPAIFLTDTTMQMEGESLSYVLRHELMHDKRHDLWYKWCCDITLCIHWFNPLVYIMSRYINVQCEISCDESLVKDLSPEEKQIYGNVLLNAVTENIKNHRQVLSSTLYEDKKSLKERIISIMNAKRKSKWIIVVSAIAAITLCVVAFWLGAYTSANRKADNEVKNTDTSVATADTATNITDIPSSNTSETNDSNNQQTNPSATTDTSTKPSDENTGTTQTSSDTNQSEVNIVYSNTDYGFDFALPVSWKGYSLLTEDWQGTAITGDHVGEVVESGKKIIIRHPDWTKDVPYQDIPIMVFTLDQWDKVVKEEIALGAAPIGPSELGSNSKYVFALPARYNFAFPTGYEEVEKIMESNPLTANENFK